LRETDAYRFELDKEAEKQLPNIIGNRVQLIEGREGLEGETAEQYGKTRNIGIVFSGGPSPGGHNVIAGLYDAAKKANPDSRIYGFLVGPDGIIENEAVELTDDLVDAYRNHDQNRPDQNRYA
jgi:pyrophosphate--fructose-6-phosphate 1-phosphotransferase